MEKRLKKFLKNGEFENVSDITSRTMSSIKGKKNKSTELPLRMALVRNKIFGWKMNYKEIKGKPDFYFPNANVAIFVDGCFWHGCSQCGHIPKTRSDFWEAKINRNKERDKRTGKLLKKDGIKVLRFWEHELKKKNDINLVIKNVIKSLESK